MTNIVPAIVFAVLVTVVESAPARAGAPFGFAEQMGAGQTLSTVLREITPAVVSIEAKRLVGQAKTGSSTARRRSGQFSANGTATAARDQYASGSGVIIDAGAGLIVTNNHVIDKSGEISVGLIDGRRFDGEKIGSDPDTDIALIKVKIGNLTAVRFGDSEGLEVGETVLAIGNPLQLGQTVTSGIVSGLHRSSIGIERYEDFIQTDAAIYPGNSGGALVNIRGQLVGINTAFIGPAKGNPGLGFAIPSKMVRAIVDQILEHGEVRHGSLGIALQDSAATAVQAARQVPQWTGAMIVKVDRQSTAEQAGLRAGDVIKEIDGAPVQNAAHLRASLALLRMGEVAELAVLREGQQVVIYATAAHPGTHTKSK